MYANECKCVCVCLCVDLFLAKYSGEGLLPVCDSFYNLLTDARACVD